MSTSTSTKSEVQDVATTLPFHTDLGRVLAVLNVLLGAVVDVSLHIGVAGDLGAHRVVEVRAVEVVLLVPGGQEDRVVRPVLVQEAVQLEEAKAVVANVLALLHGVRDSPETLLDLSVVGPVERESESESERKRERERERKRERKREREREKRERDLC